jgi:hypothetical protein
LGIQAKLAIGQPGDKYEQEADQVADQVMRMPAPEPELQRQSKKPEEDEQKKKRLQMQALQRQVESSVAEEDEKKKKQLQMKSRPAAKSEASPDLQERISGLQQGGGQSLSTSERAFFEPRFGQDFSQVRLHTDAQTANLAQAVNARAFTVGRDVVFGAGQYQPRSSEGKRLLAHELTHTLQQSNAAEQSIQCWSLEGPWNVGEPVHETLTQQSLRAAGLIGLGDKYTNEKAWEYVRGAIWNDDPTGQLFDDATIFGSPTTTNYSSGVAFYSEFKSGEKAAEKGQNFDANEISLLKRSHFGDLQFLHGMAVAGEEAAKTKGNILRWAEFTYKIGTGEIKEDTRLKDVPVAGIPALFPKLKELRVDELFCIRAELRKLADAKKRAVGSLLHMIQDTYSESHTQREKLEEGKRGKIESFHAYGEQDPELHKEKDILSGRGSLEAKVSQTPGAQDAVKQGARILTIVQKQVKWLDIDQTEGKSPKAILEEIFGLVQNPSLAGPGEEFSKNKLKPPVKLEPSKVLEPPPPWTHGGGSIF